MPGYIILLYIHVYHKQRSYAICFLKYKARQTEFFVICDYILPFDPLDNPENKNLKNWNQHPEIVSIYICAPKKTIIWCMVLLIWSITDKIFCHFGPFFAILNPMGPQSRNFEQMNKVLGDIIISQMCAINDNHMIYGFWDLEHDKAWVFCHFEPFFAILPH